MIRNQFKECELSALGMGTMRLPLKGTSPKDVDEELVGRMVDCAMELGVNYYDLAYEYHNGVCEEVMGRQLRRYPRESYYVADKFPGYVEELAKKPAEVFETQLKRTGLEYFDFYLLHAVTDDNKPTYLSEEYGIIDYLLDEKNKGRIRHLGFSSHISVEGFTQFLDARGDDMEFAQIQLNWLDWSVQEACRKVELLRKRGLPIWVMEPVRGGKLARLTTEASGKLKEARPNATDVEWCFRFLQSIPEVTMVLSGMSNLKQMTDNIEYFGKYEPLTKEEVSLLLREGERMSNEDKVLCTECGYCVPHCPVGLDIPKLIGLYNALSSAAGDPEAAGILESMPADKVPSNCIDCGGCRVVCPQGIRAGEIMKKL